MPTIRDKRRPKGRTRVADATSVTCSGSKNDRRGAVLIVPSENAENPDCPIFLRENLNINLSPSDYNHEIADLTEYGLGNEMTPLQTQETGAFNESEEDKQGN